MRPDRLLRIVHSRGRAAFDEAAKPLRMFGVAQDLTERKRAEEALQSRSRQQQAVAKLSQQALERSDLATLLDDAVAVVSQVVGVEFCNVFELLPDGTLLLRAGVNSRGT